MNASIDYWLDELDTQITELSAEELRDLRAGVAPTAPTTTREPRAAASSIETSSSRAGASDGAAHRGSSSSSGSEWPTWSGLEHAGVAC